MRVESGRDWTVYLGDCLEVMPTIGEKSVDAILTNAIQDSHAIHVLYDTDGRGL